MFSPARLTLLLVVLSPAWVSADDLAFRRHVINKDSEFMAAAVFDVNKDGKLDIVCGGFWYEGPTWKKHFLRNVELQGGRPDGYAHQVLDVNGDGWLDLITVNWRTRSVRWIEHPGADLAKDPEWKSHVIDVPGPSESGRLIDLLGDGTPVILPAGSNFAKWYELEKKKNPDGTITPNWISHALPRELIGHGLGSGDINGDGRMDIVGRNGWAEAPKDPRNGRWTWHADFDLEQASIPILVVDVDGDGLNDIVYTRGHDFGIYWLQQTRGKDNQIKWIKHAIDSSVPGCHAPIWVDLDGDGVKELVLGRRYLAHEGKDPGEYDPQAAYRYQFDKKTRTWKRWLISYNDGICFGLDPKAEDLTGSGRLDLVVGGRNGLYWLENLGKGSTLAQKLTKDPLWFPQYDRFNLMVVKDETGTEKPVKTAFDWGQRRAQILASAQSTLGTLPDSYQRVPLDIKVVSEKAGEKYLTKKITYGSDLTSRVTAHLLIPNNAKRGGPAMICLHDVLGGKNEPAAPGGIADELAQRGYVCLVPDYPTSGENAYDFTKNPGNYRTGAMKAVWDNIRGVDLLETLPEVSTKRIGIIGNGLGGQNALLSAAFDYRIAATIASGAGTSLHPTYGQQPIGTAEIIGTLVPRAVYISDDIGVKTSVAAAGQVYGLRKVANMLQAAYPDSGREFTAAARADAYKWLDQRMKR